MSILPFFNFGKMFLDISTSTTGRLDELTNTYVAGPGFPWSSLFQTIPSNLLPTYPDGTKPSVPAPVISWYLLIMDILLYAILTWYLDQVLPDQFGYRISPLFFLKPSYWGLKLPNRHSSTRQKWLKDILSKSNDIPTLEDQEDSDIVQERMLALDPGIYFYIPN